MTKRRGDQPQQVRTPERRYHDSVHNTIAAQLHGHRSLSKDVQFDVVLPFGAARFRFGSLTPIGSDGVHIPNHVDVNFSRDPKAPIRTMKLEVRQGVPMCSEIYLAARQEGAGLRLADLQVIDLANWVLDIFGECTWEIDEVGVLTHRPGSAVGRKAIRLALKPGRRRVSREQLELAAAVYRENIEGQPIKAVRAALDVPERTAARYIQMCRSDEFQLLPKTRRGKRKA